MEEIIIGTSWYPWNILDLLRVSVVNIVQINGGIPCMLFHAKVMLAFFHLFQPYSITMAAVYAVGVVYVSYLLSPGRPPENSPVTSTYRNEPRRTPFDPMADMLLNILTRSDGITMDILGSEKDGKSEESMIVIRSS